MKRPSHFPKVWLCVGMFLIYCLGQEVLAAPAVSLSDRIDQAESSIEGSIDRSHPLDARVANLESKLFGKAQKGDLSARIDRIMETVGVNSTPAPPAAEAAPASTASNDSANLMEGHVDKTDEGAGDSGHHTEMLAQLEKGVRDFSKNDYKAAEKDFQSVLAADPSNADALYNLGALAERRGALQESVNYYRLAASAKPGDSSISVALAAVEQRMAAEGQAQTNKSAALRSIGAAVGHATFSALAVGAGAFGRGWSAVPNARPIDTCGVCAPVLGRRW